MRDIKEEIEDLGRKAARLKKALSLFDDCELYSYSDDIKSKKANKSINSFILSDDFTLNFSYDFEYEFDGKIYKDSIIPEKSGQIVFYQNFRNNTLIYKKIKNKLSKELLNDVYVEIIQKISKYAERGWKVETSTLDKKLKKLIAFT